MYKIFVFYLLKCTFEAQMICVICTESRQRGTSRAEHMCIVFCIVKTIFSPAAQMHLNLKSKHTSWSTAYSINPEKSKWDKAQVLDLMQLHKCKYLRLSQELLILFRI